MKRGAILFAHNSENTDYYKMAAYTAGRIERFLNIPTTVITDANSITCDYAFDNIILREPDRSNTRKKSVWINKGRYQVFDMTPYDDTLVLDTDYMVNSAKLLRTFELPGDFVSHRRSKFLMENIPSERIGKNGFETMWATVMRFTKTQRTSDIFKLIEMIQNNYSHYSELHNFVNTMYRNDYALTLALRIANGHFERTEDYIPWNLLHVGNQVKVLRLTDTEYRLDQKTKEGRPTYMTVKDCDFHMLSKDNFMEIAK